MARNPGNDAQFFMVFVGSRNESGNDGDFAGVLMGFLVAAVIVLMVFAGLLEDAQRQRQQEQGSQLYQCGQTIDGGFRPCNGQFQESPWPRF